MGFTHCALGEDPLCGDSITVYLRIEAGTVRDIGFDGQACALATASASLMTEAFMGRELAHVRSVQAALRPVLAGERPDGGAPAGTLDVLGAIARFPSRAPCARLAWQALEAALADAPPSSREDA